MLYLTLFLIGRNASEDNLSSAVIDVSYVLMRLVLRNVATDIGNLRRIPKHTHVRLGYRAGSDIQSLCTFPVRY